MQVIQTKLDYITSEVSEIKGDVKDLKNRAVLKDDLKDIKVEIDSKVDKIEFATVKNLTYGFAGLVLTAVVIALVSLVIIR